MSVSPDEAGEILSTVWCQSQLDFYCTSVKLAVCLWQGGLFESQIDLPLNLQISLALWIRCCKN